MTARSLTIAGTSYPVQLPSLRDPRLHLAATITSLHVIGQVYLEFELSIAQILVCLLTCAAIEVPLVLREQRVIAWPASALLTGNGVAFILRFNGTEHGDWWAMDGWYVFAMTAAVALLSKHVLRARGRPVFNPSNIGLVLCFLILGTDRVNPLDFWWGPLSAPMVAVIAVIAAGGMVVTRRLGLLPVSAAFWLAFAGGLAVVAATGHCMAARWSVTPVCGGSFWGTLVTSPEILVFLLFMVTDPKTTPATRSGRLVFGAAVGLTAALLVAPTRTEFWAKVAVLSALVVVCAVRVLTGRLSRTPDVRRTAPVVAVVAVPLLVAAGLPARDPLPGVAVPDSAVLKGRPEVSTPTPPVTIEAEVDRIFGKIDQEHADRIARDLLADLAIEHDALSTGDRKLLDTALTGRRLDEALAATVAPAPPPSFSRLTLTVLRTPGDPQAVPRLALRGDSMVYVLAAVDGTYLLADVLPIDVVFTTPGRIPTS